MPPVTPGQQVPHPSPFPNTYSGDINTVSYILYLKI